MLIVSNINAYKTEYENNFTRATQAFGSGINPGDDPNDTQPPIAAGPVGDGVEIVACLGLIYVLYRVNKKQKVFVTVER
ncbi:hypothetical protein AGMMS50239_10670 [Bacteroidia bacterium]|nr:hypothetical protein AGMMS50239_10670 [Bacteroidia bacterium]